jgi:FKBP-type peptidyl-prolyl cis-trans isomerase FkpA
MLSRLFLLFSFCTLLFSSCVKSTDTNNNTCTYTASTIVVPTSEMTTLQAYIAANHPTAILDPGGFYYEITAAGTGTVTPAICKGIAVKYSGKLTNGTVFDASTTPVTFTLGQLIVGWQRGIPLIKKGGSIKLYLPPSLGYGSTAAGTIPANSITIFTIDLVDVEQ